MKDMQASGNNYSVFSQNLSELTSAANYYLKSGYFSPSEYEISKIYKFYKSLSDEILLAKTDAISMSDRNELYKAYCKVRQMLSDSVFVNVILTIPDEPRFECSPDFIKIQKIYIKCLQSFEHNDENHGSYEDASASFYVRDVLVGVLRNRQQLDICLEKGFYHIPAQNLSVPVEDISCIAIYQSKNLFGDNSCIRYYGMVDSYNLLKRSEITEIPKNSDKSYYKFTISNWQKLDKPISTNGGGLVCETTSRYLLFTSSDVFELNFKDLSLCRLYRTIRNSILSGRDRVACRHRNMTFALENNTISAYSNRVNHYCVSTEEYLKNPSKHFWNMLKSVNRKRQ